MPRRKIPHFRFYPSNFLEGTREMTAAEVGDYIRLLAFIYDKDGMVLFEPYQLRHLLGCTKAPDVIRKVQRLIDLGKLSLNEDGCLHNGRADREIEKRHEFQTRSPAAKGAANHAAKGAASTVKNHAKTNGAGTSARAFPEGCKKEKKEKRDGRNRRAAMASSPGGEGRSEATPPDSVHDPPPALQEKLAALAGEAVPAYLFEKLKRH